MQYEWGGQVLLGRLAGNWRDGCQAEKSTAIAD
jgi:hypothetical protein